ncbi:unnamed protein product [Rotaria sp. Silwood1]|nr:unnamed protein product [Rotaria sp. Silwood1]CAF1633236.1 unnamed protein product [Rotaria sp. Silwood1]
MSFHPKMVETGTGASPPASKTREMATSPIKFYSLIESSTSDDSSDCSTMDNRKNTNVENIGIMNEMVNKQSMLPFPSSSTNGSSSNTPVLSSLPSSTPVPLMSIELNNRNRFNSITNPTATIGNNNNIVDHNRRWPINSRSEGIFKRQKRRARENSRYQRHHYQQCYCRQCFFGARTGALGNALIKFVYLMR